MTSERHAHAHTRIAGPLLTAQSTRAYQALAQHTRRALLTKRVWPPHGVLCTHCSRSQEWAAALHAAPNDPGLPCSSCPSVRPSSSLPSPQPPVLLSLCPSLPSPNRLLLSISRRPVDRNWRPRPVTRVTTIPRRDLLGGEARCPNPGKNPGAKPIIKSSQVHRKLPVSE